MIDRLFEWEGKLRKLASYYQGYDIESGREIPELKRKADSGEWSTLDLIELFKTLHEFCDEMAEIKEWASNTADIAPTGRIADKLRELKTLANILCRMADKIEDMVCSGGRVNPVLDSGELREYAEEVSKRIGDACGYLVRASEKVPFQGAVNDLANCVHKVAEYLARELKGSEGKCVVVMPGKSRELCRRWDFWTERLKKKYSDKDRGKLAGFVYGGKAYFRVGSATGHAAEVDLDAGRLLYYDDDEFVNRLMDYLFTMAGAECEVTGELPGVKCDIKDADMDKLAYALANATSLDINLGGAAEYILNRAFSQVTYDDSDKLHVMERLATYPTRDILEEAYKQMKYAVDVIEKEASKIAEEVGMEFSDIGRDIVDRLLDELA